MTEFGKRETEGPIQRRYCWISRDFPDVGGAARRFTIRSEIGSFRMNRRNFLQSAATAAKKPNIVIIFADDFDFGSLNCNGADPKLIARRIWTGSRKRGCALPTRILRRRCAVRLVML